MKKAFLLCFFLLFAACTNAFALEKPTHEAINKLNAPIINQQLINIGFSRGVEDYVGGKQIIRQIQLGGLTEDEPLYTRSLNHFFDPLTNKGFKGNFKTALEWAKDQNGVLLSNDCSWGATKGYYRLGLTSPTMTDRDNSLALTFECVGRLMHLVQDMSVPAHTRDDFHFLFDYEQWVKGKESQFTSQSIPYVGTITSIDPLFLNLASYTNANFFSDDTIFDPKYPNPAYVNTNAVITEVIAEDGLIDRIGYIHFTGQTRNLAAYSYFSQLLNHYTRDANNQGGIVFPVGWHYVLDDKVYSDYAALLLPRAVGYSSQLLEHFFRGQIEMKKDVDEPGNYVIWNESHEAINGMFTLYYDDTSGYRQALPVDLSAANGITLAPGAKSSSIPSFTEPSDINEPGQYMLVFEGTIGSEQGSIAGKAVSLDSGLWEDFEGPGGFRQNWLPPKHYPIEYQYEVVKGYGSNTTNVLKISGITIKKSWEYIYVPIPASTPMPKTISFDYFAKSINLTKWGFGYLTLRVSGIFPNGQVYAVDAGAINANNGYYNLGCGQYSFTKGAFYEYCNDQVTPGAWVKVTMPLSKAGTLKGVYFFIAGYSEGKPYEIYIDNIDLQQ